MAEVAELTTTERVVWCDGPTNNWIDPAEMKPLTTEHYRRPMAGRTMYVIPFCTGPLSAEEPKLGVEITDSAYVVCDVAWPRNPTTALTDELHALRHRLSAARQAD